MSRSLSTYKTAEVYDQRISGPPVQSFCLCSDQSRYVTASASEIALEGVIHVPERVVTASFAIDSNGGTY